MHSMLVGQRQCFWDICVKLFQAKLYVEDLQAQIYIIMKCILASSWGLRVRFKFEVNTRGFRVSPSGKFVFTSSKVYSMPIAWTQLPIVLLMFKILLNAKYLWHKIESLHLKWPPSTIWENPSLQKNLKTNRFGSSNYLENPPKFLLIP